MAMYRTCATLATGAVNGTEVGLLISANEAFTNLRRRRSAMHRPGVSEASARCLSGERVSASQLVYKETRNVVLWPHTPARTRTI